MSLSVFFGRDENRLSYPGVYALLDEFAVKAGLWQRIRLRIMPGSGLDGTVSSPFAIYLTEPVLNLEDPQVIGYFVAHEMIHIKYWDFLKNIYLHIDYDKFCALRILCEFRADMEGLELAGITGNDIKTVHDVAENPLERADKITCYESGYPERSQRIFYSQKYKDFDVNLFDEVLFDFCFEMRIEKPSAFLRSVKRSFR
ncbi:hypothetical protein H1S01_04990 [Heliobacterium chlorum]|uniref:Uncharacterized protein n=1 Tax=Heliobacterium chlorum TaxID=2698 RepID=A0ABR7T1Y3_HELCL|nr:hypothetical protein [Heliobacterium chlorum]MBC9783864.1 hypothetical protein [Heliobacterium chlorum]